MCGAQARQAQSHALNTEGVYGCKAVVGARREWRPAGLLDEGPVHVGEEEEEEEKGEEEEDHWVPFSTSHRQTNVMDAKREDMGDRQRRREEECMRVAKGFRMECEDGKRKGETLIKKAM
jgi:hypothetical protein